MQTNIRVFLRTTAQRQLHLSLDTSYITGVGNSVFSEPFWIFDSIRSPYKIVYLEMSLLYLVKL